MAQGLTAQRNVHKQVAGVAVTVVPSCRPVLPFTIGNNRKAMSVVVENLNIRGEGIFKPVAEDAAQRGSD
jgi:hypothetical protein